METNSNAPAKVLQVTLFDENSNVIISRPVKSFDMIVGLIGCVDDNTTLSVSLV